MRMHKRWGRYGCLAGIAWLLLLSGCENTAQRPIVALKKSSAVNQTFTADTTLTIAEQVNAPDTYQADLDEPLLKLTADAKVTVPEGNGIKIKGVKSRGFTKKELRAMEKLERRQGRSYEFQSYNTWTDKTPDVYAFLQVQETEAYSSDSPSDISVYQEETERSQGEASSLPVKKIRREADNLIKELGLSELELAGEYTGYQLSEESYVLEYTRTVDGIPVTYTYQEGNGVSDEIPIDWIPWREERLELVYDEHGLRSFTRINPYVITDLSEESVFLLPFSEIQKIFESVLTTSYSDSVSDSEYSSADSGVFTGVQVTAVRLGYMRVRDEEESTAKLIPVWDFFGSVTRSQGAENSYMISEYNPYVSLLTINAMDGTILDRYLGY